MDPRIVVQAITPAMPHSIADSLVGMVSGVIQQAEGRIIDWGTTVLSSQQAMNEEIGQELLVFTMVVTALEVPDGIE